jgi:hypothetical protein
MHLVDQCKQFATDHRRLAAMLTNRADKQALELLAAGWDRVAENGEAMLRSKEGAEPTDVRSKSAIFSGG